MHAYRVLYKYLTNAPFMEVFFSAGLSVMYIFLPLLLLLFSIPPV